MLLSDVQNDHHIDSFIPLLLVFGFAFDREAGGMVGEHYGTS